MHEITIYSCLHTMDGFVEVGDQLIHLQRFHARLKAIAISKMVTEQDLEVMILAESNLNKVQPEVMLLLSKHRTENP